jgi:hypothetical protein
MSSILKNKLLHINNFNILLFNYKQLLLIFNELEQLIEKYYKNREITKHEKLNYEILLLDIKFNHCKNHIEYFKFKRRIKFYN